MGSHDPIAYTYDADTHCPDCTLKRFGRTDDGFIAGQNDDGSESLDSEGNPVGIIAPWDSWHSGLEGCEILTCGSCLEVIDRAHDSEVCAATFGSDKCVPIECSHCDDLAVYRFGGYELCTPCTAIELEETGFHSFREAILAGEIARIHPAEPSQSETLF